MDNLWILAQAPGEDASSTVKSTPLAEESTETMTATKADSNMPAQETGTQRFSLTAFLPFILILLMMYLLLFRGPRKKQQEHKQMVKSLQKNDKVRTIGGIIGTIVDIKDDEVTLKIDESNNTKIKIASSAIGKNVSRDKD